MRVGGQRSVRDEWELSGGRRSEGSWNWRKQRCELGCSPAPCQPRRWCQKSKFKMEIARGLLSWLVAGGQRRRKWCSEPYPGRMDHAVHLETVKKKPATGKPISDFDNAQRYLMMVGCVGVTTHSCVKFHKTERGTLRGLHGLLWALTLWQISMSFGDWKITGNQIHSIKRYGHFSSLCYIMGLEIMLLKLHSAGRPLQSGLVFPCRGGTDGYVEICSTAMVAQLLKLKLDLTPLKTYTLFTARTACKNWSSGL